MKIPFWVRMLLASSVMALFLCSIAWSLNHLFIRRNLGELSNGVRLIFAKVVETEGLEKLNHYRSDNTVFTAYLWEVRGKDKVVASNNDENLPANWKTLDRPKEPYGIALDGDLSVIRLNTPDERYLVMESQAPSVLFKGYWANAAWIFALFTSVGSAAVWLLVVYLRLKSAEARQVLAELEGGNLKARFPIRRLDEVGSLMLDFNRMADEIERLVGRLREVECSRRMLIQELGHDLRTPLMSLRTSVDALLSDWGKMQNNHRETILRACQAEIAYYGDLVDGLVLIAQIEEPKYRTPSEEVNLTSLVESQVSYFARKPSVADRAIQWSFNRKEEPASIHGDAQLLGRMVRNLLENAGRFAKGNVQATVTRNADRVQLQIEDDGPGMSAEEIAHYGEARKRRHIRSGSQTREISSGLGSVIVRRILSLHHGSLEIVSRDRGIDGTSIRLQFPAFLQ